MFQEGAKEGKGVEWEQGAESQTQEAGSRKRTASPLWSHDLVDSRVLHVLQSRHGYNITQTCDHKHCDKSCDLREHRKHEHGEHAISESTANMS